MKLSSDETQIPACGGNAFPGLTVDAPTSTPQACYVLVSGEGDVYAEMAFISVSLLRTIHPDFHIRIVVDRPTEISLVQRKSKLFDIAEVVAYGDTGESVPVYRSRFLKTSIRQIVDGHFLLLDVDTLPLAPCHEIFSPAMVLGAAFDRNADNPEPHWPGWVEPVYRSLGWSYPLPQYFNTGVLYFPDTAAARGLGEEWHRRWRQTARLGMHQDQPAFNSALHALALPARVLPLRFNAMIAAHPRFAAGASIVHTFASTGAPAAGTILHDLMQAVLNRDEIDWEEKRSLLVRGPLDAHARPNATAGNDRYRTAMRLLVKRWMVKCGYSRNRLRRLSWRNMFS